MAQYSENIHQNLSQTLDFERFGRHSSSRTHPWKRWEAWKWHHRSRVSQSTPTPFIVAKIKVFIKWIALESEDWVLIGEVSQRFCMECVLSWLCCQESYLLSMRYSLTWLPIQATLLLIWIFGCTASVAQVLRITLVFRIRSAESVCKLLQQGPIR